MKAISYKTISANSATVTKDWVILNAENQVLGRFCSKVAMMLRGKHKANYTPHVDCGDNIVIINAEKIRLTGKKMTAKVYTRHTGYPGGQRFASPAMLLQKHPERVIENAVKGMLPTTKLSSALLRNLHVYAGTEHPHSAQTPKEIKL